MFFRNIFHRVEVFIYLFVLGGLRIVYVRYLLMIGVNLFFYVLFFPFPTDFLSPHPPFPIIETIFEILSIFVLSHLSLSLRFVSFGSRLNAEPFYLLFNHKHLEWFCFHPSTRSFCFVFPQFYSMHKLCDEHHVRSFCPASLCVR